MKNLILAMVVMIANKSYAADKLAKSVTCEVNATIAAEKIPESGRSMSDLLINSTKENLVTFEVGCELLNKPDGRCSGSSKGKQLEVAYRYNAKSERGTVAIYDDVTGLSADTAWIKEDGVNTNYENKILIGGMRTVALLQSKKGGLLGRNEVFSMEVICSPNY